MPWAPQRQGPCPNSFPHYLAQSPALSFHRYLTNQWIKGEREGQRRDGENRREGRREEAARFGNHPLGRTRDVLRHLLGVLRSCQGLSVLPAGIPNGPPACVWWFSKELHPNNESLKWDPMTNGFRRTKHKHHCPGDWSWSRVLPEARLSTFLFIIRNPRQSWTLLYRRD